MNTREYKEFATAAGLFEHLNLRLSDHDMIDAIIAVSLEAKMTSGSAIFRIPEDLPYSVMTVNTRELGYEPRQWAMLASGLMDKHNCDVHQINGTLIVLFYENMTASKLFVAGIHAGTFFELSKNSI